MTEWWGLAAIGCVDDGKRGGEEAAGRWTVNKGRGAQHPPAVNVFAGCAQSVFGDEGQQRRSIRESAPSHGPRICRS